MKLVTEEFLGDGVTGFHLIGNNMGGGIQISETDILNMTAKCSKTKELLLEDMAIETWPTLIAPWMSVTSLMLRDTRLRADLFSDVKLHHSLPNLEIFSLSVSSSTCQESVFQWCPPTPIVLPDMGRCKNLKSVTLTFFHYPLCSSKLSAGLLEGDFLVQDLGLPRDLREIKGIAKVANVNRASFEVLFKKCYIGAGIEFRGDYIDGDDDEGSEDD